MTPLSSIQTKRALRFSTLDGILANVMVALTSGVFLTGFAIALGATNIEIGILASLPLLANLFQVVSAYLMEHAIHRKRFFISAATISRGLWIAVILFPGILFPKGGAAVWLMIAIIAVSSVFAALAGVVWLNWMRDIVPTTHLGRYFASRNRWCSVSFLSATLLGARVLDLWHAHYPHNSLVGFAIIFTAGLIFGILALIPASRVPDPYKPLPPAEEPFLSLLREPLRDGNFRRLAFYSMSWGFALNVAAPFFIVYMLEDLRISFTTISIFSIIEQVIFFSAIIVWGRFTDRFGNKPVLVVAGTAGSISALLWVFSSPQNYVIIPFIYALNGIAFSAIPLATNNILLKLSPTRHNTVYLSVFAAMTALGAAIAPIIGGAFAHLLRSYNFTVRFEWTTASAQLSVPVLHLFHFHFLFILACLLRLLATGTLKQVTEAGEVHPRRLVRILANTRTLASMIGVQWFIHYLVEVPVRYVRRARRHEISSESETNETQPPSTE
jgi:MFS family permease